MPFHRSPWTWHPVRAGAWHAAWLAALALACGTALDAQAPASMPQAPDWAYPGTATRTQVPPPADFRRASTHYQIPLGIFEGQSDVGTAVVPGSASFDAATGTYTITSAGYNIWYDRDEFRFRWKRMSGDVSLAADIAYPDPNGYGDRKAVLVIRQDLADDSPQVVVAPHGAGMIQLPMHQFGAPITQTIDGPFYVGIGFCSHLPDTVDTALISNVVLENAAGKVR